MLGVPAQSNRSDSTNLLFPTLLTSRSRHSNTFTALGNSYTILGCSKRRMRVQRWKMTCLSSSRLGRVLQAVAVRRTQTLRTSSTSVATMLLTPKVTSNLLVETASRRFRALQRHVNHPCRTRRNAQARQSSLVHTYRAVHPIPETTYQTTRQTNIHDSIMATCVHHSLGPTASRCPPLSGSPLHHSRQGLYVLSMSDPIPRLLQRIVRIPHTQLTSGEQELQVP
jgi:hypothetical protein